MMSIEVEEKLGPVLSRIAAELDGPGRERLSRAMGSEVRALIVRHLAGLGESRHATAQRLGAAETGYIRNLAENFDQASTVEVDEDGVSISMSHPVISRAVRDITILPKSGEYLTIPLNAMAYGRRAREFGGKVVLVKPRGERKQKLEIQSEGRKPIRNDLPAYLLVRSVTQKRDPSLLPSLDEINTAAARGAGREIKALLTEANLT